MSRSIDGGDSQGEVRGGHVRRCARFALVVSLAGCAGSVAALDSASAARDCAARIAVDSSTGVGTGTPPLPGEHAGAELRRIVLRVEPGDSLERLFTAQRLSRQALYRMLTNREFAEAMRALRPGDQIQVEVEDRQPSRLLYQPDPWRYLEMVRAGNDYEGSWKPTCPERRIETTSVIIASSLYEAGRAAGLSSRLVLRLGSIFAPVADMSRDLHPGDRLSVVYERLLRDGEPLGEGAVLAAELITSKRAVRLFRRANGDRVDYYRADGTAVLGTGFERPVRMADVSSGFTNTRRHPVLGRTRPHEGLDFAARVGTPIVATADGRITFKGQQRGYGNTIVLDHGGGHGTLYAHLSRFGSGLTSGPNLHYEVRIDGVPVDPRRHAHETDSRLVGVELREFEDSIRPLVERLDASSPAALDRSA